MAAAAKATRCCSPPDSSEGYERGPVGEPHRVQELERLGGVHAPQPGRQLDLLVGA